jgi:hypothetical protein
MTTTREQLIDGFQMIIREGLRIGATFSPEDWKYQVHGEENGWNTKQVYCHLSATAEITPGLVGGLSQAPPDQDVTASFDINAINAQTVAAREGLSEAELLDQFKTNHEKLIGFINTMPQEQLDQRRRFGHIEAPVADIMQTVLVLHGLWHIFQAQSR